MKSSPMSLFEEFIKEAFGSQYIIPVYQRNYTWKKNKQVKQLLSDIENILRGETKKHFIGTIVYNIVNTNFMVREREVVDGQQRLITMFLISYALRNIARDRNESDIETALTNSYLENPGENRYKYRLQPSVSDDDAYSYITKDMVSAYSGDSIVMENYKYIYDKLNEFVEKYSLMDVINAVRMLYIVRIELDPDDDAQQIFESINSTGEKLTAADLIRNYILMRRTNQEQEDIYKKYWLNLEMILPDSKKLAEYIRFYLAVKTYTLTTEKDLYDAFKEYWKSKNGFSNYESILTDMVNFARHYNRLYLENSVDELGESISDYRRLQSYMPAPFTMSILEHLRLNHITNQQAIDVLVMLNTYLIRRYINGQDTSAISRFFPSYLKKVESQLLVYGNYSKYTEICIYFLVNENMGKSAFMPDDIQIRSYLETANAYMLSNIRIVLDKIECYKNPAPVDLSALSIEHIMPQTQSEYWANVSGMDIDAYTKTVNLIGNLTLASKSDNSKMSNRNFDDKKKILYSTKHLKLNEEIINKQNWTVDDIYLRTQRLIDKIIEIYPYKKSNYQIVGLDNSRNITLEAKGIVAFGYLNEDNTLTVYADSQIKYNILPISNSLKEMRDDLLQRDIVEFKNGQYIFVQSYTFNSPSAATDFILGGSNNGWQYWKDNNDIIIGDSLRNR